MIADEAHRSQYDFIDGYARHMRDALPNASFIAFTGTPIEVSDKNTRQVFEEYISIYDIQRAVQGGATVPIYYESRLAQLELDQAEKPKLDEASDEVTETEEQDRKEKLKSKWSALEAVVGAEKRVRLIAQDLVRHFEERQSAMDGKAMVVCMSRRICVDLYNAIVELRPDWHHENDDKGALKIIMTGSESDPEDWQNHIRNKPRRDALARRFKDAADPFKIVIVRDTWLTGFDAPCLTRGQAHARARTHAGDRSREPRFAGQAGRPHRGLPRARRSVEVRARDLHRERGQGDTAVPKAEAVAAMQERHEICCGLFHGSDWSAWHTGTAQQKMALLPSAADYVFKLEDGRARLLSVVSELSKAFALAVPDLEAEGPRRCGVLPTVRSAVAKSTADGAKPDEDPDQAIRQIVSRAISTDGVIDLFSAAGLKKAEISILSDEFLAEVRGLPHRNLALELLRKLIKDELKTRTRKNLVQSRQFSAMLESAIRKHHNRGVETAQVIEELIALSSTTRLRRRTW